jgi:hypothetical protein
MEINQLALVEILRDLTHHMELLAQDVESLLMTLHVHQSAGEAQRPVGPLLTEHANPVSIRALHQRLDAISQELRKQS